MLKNGISSKSIETMQPIFDLSGDFNSKLDSLKIILINSEIGMVGISELEWIFNTICELRLKKIKIEFDVTLARGLNYYTGSIIEVSPPKELSIGSIGGGGRYDDLTGIFGLKGLSGVGISFGLDRIALILEELELFPNLNYQSTQILFSNFGYQESVYSLKLIQKLREYGITTELYPDAVKLKKQISYANKKEIPYVALVGDEEIKLNKITLKKMSDGSQNTFDINDLIKKFAK
jgi:histidyl-tRNA synthetase